MKKKFDIPSKKSHLGLKKNMTFRLPEKLVEDFITICDKTDVTRTAALEWLIESFVKENKKHLSKKEQDKY